MNYKEFNKSSRLSEKTDDITENILSMVPFIEASKFHEILNKHAKLSCKTINNKNGMFDYVCYNFLPFLKKNLIVFENCYLKILIEFFL